MLNAGGSDENTFLASAELYDPETNAWSPANPMSEAPAATLLESGKVLGAGGQQDIDLGNTTTAELYTFYIVPTRVVLVLCRRLCYPCTVVLPVQGDDAMTEPFFPISSGSAPVMCKCESGPRTVKDGTGRDSEGVSRSPGVDEAIVKAEQRCTNRAAQKALSEASEVIKEMNLRCDPPCTPRLVVTLSDYRAQEETGHSSAGEGVSTTITYLVSAEVDWTVEFYCEKKRDAPAQPSATAAHEDDDGAVGHDSPSGKKSWIKIKDVVSPGGCTSKQASGAGDGFGISRPPTATAAAAEKEAKENAMNDATAQINEQVERMRCAKKCKKQKTEIEFTDFTVTSSAAKVYGGMANGFEARATVGWTAYVRCSEP